MGIAALVLGIIALASAVTPLFYPQLAGVVLGVFALVLGIMGRRQARSQGRGTGVATAGMIAGIVAMALSVLVYTSCMYTWKKVGDEFESHMKRGGGEFQRAMKEAFDKAAKEQRRLQETRLKQQPVEKEK